MVNARLVQPQRLDTIAQRFGLILRGDPAVEVDGMCTLSPGLPGRLGFLANPRYRPQLKETRATAVIVSETDAAYATGNVLIAPNPYLAFARVARLFEVAPADSGPAVHPSAVVADDANLGSGVRIGPLTVIEAGATLGAGSRVGPNCVIGQEAQLGADCEVLGNVHIGARVVVGDRCRFQPGAVVGSRGFGLARGPDGWEDVPQLGTVVLGNDVEVGANTTIDRGAIDDTVLADGVKLDNLVQIAHNVRIGKNTAIAGCAAVAGSTHIGANCLIGGGVGINGHVRLCDGVIVLGFTMVTRSIDTPGQYGSGWPVEPARVWHGQLRRLRKLDRLEQRLAQLEAGNAGHDAEIKQGESG